MTTKQTATITPIKAGAKAKAGPKRKTTTKRGAPPAINQISKKWRGRATATTAAVTPLMGGTFAHYAAELAVAGNDLAYVPAGIAVAVLLVSLPHVAAGLGRCTGQGKFNCYALAFAIDCGMCACKAGLMLGSLSAPLLLWAMLFGLGGFSGWMNYVAYSLRHED